MSRSRPTHAQPKVDPTAEDTGATLTADLMTRGRMRARELLEPAFAEAERSQRRRRGLGALFEGVSRRDLILAVVWVAVFAGCFLLVRLGDL